MRLSIFGLLGCALAEVKPLGNKASTTPSTSTPPTNKRAETSTTSTSVDLLRGAKDLSMKVEAYPIGAQWSGIVTASTKMTFEPFLGEVVITTTSAFPNEGEGDVKTGGNRIDCEGEMCTETVSVTSNTTAFKVGSAVMVASGPTAAVETSFASTITAYDNITTEIMPLTATAQSKRTVITASETGLHGLSSAASRKRSVAFPTFTQPILDPGLQKQLVASITVPRTITIVHVTVLATITNQAMQDQGPNTYPTTVVADIYDGTTLTSTIPTGATTTTWVPVSSDTTLAVTLDKATIITVLTPPTASENLVERDMPQATALPPVFRISAVEPAVRSLKHKPRDDHTSSTDSSVVAAPIITRLSSPTLPVPTNAAESQIEENIREMLDTSPGHCHPSNCRRDATSTPEVVPRTAIISGMYGFLSTNSRSMVERETPRATALPALPNANKRRDDAASLASTSREINDAVSALLNTDPAGFSHPGDDRRDASPSVNVVPRTTSTPGPDGLPTVVYNSLSNLIHMSARSDNGEAAINIIPSITKLVSTTLTTMVRERQMFKSATVAAREAGDAEDDNSSSSAPTKKNPTVTKISTGFQGDDTKSTTTQDTGDPDATASGVPTSTPPRRTSEETGSNDSLDAKETDNPLTESTVEPLSGALKGVTSPTGDATDKGVKVAVEAVTAACSEAGENGQTVKVGSAEAAVCAVAELVAQANGESGTTNPDHLQQKDQKSASETDGEGDDEGGEDEGEKPKGHDATQNPGQDPITDNRARCCNHFLTTRHDLGLRFD
ncbi:hypothetical protein LTR78_007870 [Recurvomyces mirabilis]|uniref:Uncharacterized protein n=1 Tax=Recurvomyces mirabilis TaxID=574656 RepID=A0AAE0WHY9_9PEZI|nr:hypothetical protein LTR78_007870 [Recurvomyces mirabilis]KAK5160090.1 hypothetical protein LTS14_002197 [Recurvomyces mirabilis]